jgi:hypothetical protein
MPAWIVGVLAGNMGRLQAEEMQTAAIVTMLPYMYDDDRRRVLRQIEIEATRGDPPTPRETIEVIEYNPDKAREWFEGGGIHVERSNDNVSSQN